MFSRHNVRTTPGMERTSYHDQIFLTNLQLAGVFEPVLPLSRDSGYDFMVSEIASYHGPFRSICLCLFSVISDWVDIRQININV